MPMPTRRVYFETQETVTTTRKGWFEIETDYTQVYHNIFKYTKNLKSKYGMHYLHWIMDKANDFNMVPHNEKVIEEFCREFEDRPSKGTVRNAISELVKAGIFIKYSNSSYQLNPVIFWTQEIKERFGHIRDMRVFPGLVLLEEKTNTEK